MIYVSVSLVEATAKDTIEDLEREVLRSVRQRSLERGVSALQAIEGVEAFLFQVRLRARSEISRRNGDVIECSPGNAQVTARIAELRRRSVERKTGAKQP